MLIRTTRTATRFIPRSIPSSSSLNYNCRCIYNSFHTTSPTLQPQPPPLIISLQNATFYRHHPNSTIPPSSNPPLFPSLTFTLPSTTPATQHWSIIGPSSSGKTTLLQSLQGQHLCIPPTSRTYPYLESSEIDSKNHSFRNPNVAIKLVGFDGEQSLGSQAPTSAYLSARYESRREDTDFSVLDYLKGNTQLNLSAEDIDGRTVDEKVLERVVRNLRLEELVGMPVGNLSNGQTRRARIARALLGGPEVLLLDEPFMGLDPGSVVGLSGVLRGLGERGEPRLVLSLRPQDPIPEWITHLIYLGEGCEVIEQGRKDDVLKRLWDRFEGVKKGKIDPEAGKKLDLMHEMGRTLTSNGIVDNSSLYKESHSISISAARNATNPSEPTKLSRDGYPLHDTHAPKIGSRLVEMSGAIISYGPKTVLGNWTQPSSPNSTPGLHWTVRRGERWGIFGPNGSGKTTLLSLICSDHPQTYSLPIKLFGRSRLPEPGKPGISIFDLQKRIGHSSPEIHGHIPRGLTVRGVVENAWSETFRGVPRLEGGAGERVDACLGWFEGDLRPDADMSKGKGRQNGEGRPTWANDLIFGELPFSSQRVALFLRAIIKAPDLVILDEAFSGMDESVRDKCLLFLAHGQNKTFSSTGEIIDWNGGEVKVGGLGDEQALIVISHVKEEIPGSVREWICLPEGGGGVGVERGQGEPARFGRLEGPIEGDWGRWGEIWGV